MTLPSPASQPPGPACPLCGTPGSDLWHQDRRRTYRHCGHCRLVFVPAAEHIPPEAEKAQYDLHENALDDPGYRRFLGRIADAVLARAAPGSTGIDIGCGPAPLLAHMLGEGGLLMRVYDPYFAPDRTPLAARYDVVTASEVVEHFRDPAAGFAGLFARVAPGGLLAVMTKRVRDREAFARWHYILDPTHVAFYAEDTFRWLAGAHGVQLEVVGDDVVVFTRATDDNAAMTPADTAWPAA